MHKFEELRNNYLEFIYKDYTIEKLESIYKVTYNFCIPGLCEFHPTWEFPVGAEIEEEILKNLIFQLGMVELISYWKCACPPTIKVLCGKLSKQQRAWWKKLYFNGLGEFFYVNDIETTQEDFAELICEEGENTPMKDEAVYKGCLVPIGGGKDSVVSLEVLRAAKEDVTTFSINRIAATSKVIDVYDYKTGDILVKRKLDLKLIELNKEGYLNGHTPFSAIVAFSSVITAFLHKKKYITLSNETSANESTVKDSNVNHQYSKSYEFEQDFEWYMSTILDTQIRYFSLLRPLSELQIAMLFARYKMYHPIFRSCNVGSKEGIWCANCAKCLFVYIILAPFLTQDELVQIFGENLLDKESLDLCFRELIGVEDNKPFECVGTRNEVLLSLKYLVEAGYSSILTNRYMESILAEVGDISQILSGWVEENSVPEEYQGILKRCLIENEHNK